MKLCNFNFLVRILIFIITFKSFYSNHTRIIVLWYIDFGLGLLRKEDVTEIIFFILCAFRNCLNNFIRRYRDSWKASLKLYRRRFRNQCSVSIEYRRSLTSKWWTVWLLPFHKDAIASLYSKAYIWIVRLVGNFWVALLAHLVHLVWLKCLI